MEVDVCFESCKSTFETACAVSNPLVLFSSSSPLRTSSQRSPRTPFLPQSHSTFLNSTRRPSNQDQVNSILFNTLYDLPASLHLIKKVRERSSRWSQLQARLAQAGVVLLVLSVGP